MLDKSFKGDLQSQIHTVDAASNTTNQLASSRVFMHYTRILFQCNQDYKRLYIDCQKGPYVKVPQTNGSLQSYPSCICTTFLYIPFACTFHAEDSSIDLKSFLQLLCYKNQQGIPYINDCQGKFVECYGTFFFLLCFFSHNFTETTRLFFMKLFNVLDISQISLPFFSSPSLKAPTFSEICRVYNNFQEHNIVSHIGVVI